MQTTPHHHDRMDAAFTNSPNSASANSPAAATTAVHRDQPPGPPFDRTYQPTSRDVCSGRGKKHWNLPGNIAFRNHIQTRVAEYLMRTTKIGKTEMVATIVIELRQQGFQFLKQTKEGHWYDIGDQQARDKVGHSLRDQVTAIRKQAAGGGAGDDSTATTQTNGVLAALALPQQQQWQQQLLLRQQQQQQLQQRRPSICLSDSGHESDLRRSALESTSMYATFARRPSWIASEQDHDDAWKYVDKFMEMDVTSSMAEEDIPVVADVEQIQHHQPPPQHPQRQHPAQHHQQDEASHREAVRLLLQDALLQEEHATTTADSAMDVSIVGQAAPPPVVTTMRNPLLNSAASLAAAAALTGRFNASLAARGGHNHNNHNSAMTTDDPAHSLLKASLMSFEGRMSTISNPFRRSSILSGRSSLRNFTTQQFRFSDVSMASEIFESFSASDDDDDAVQRVVVNGNNNNNDSIASTATPDIDDLL
jgi:hypothetical protein